PAVLERLLPSSVPPDPRPVHLAVVGRDEAAHEHAIALGERAVFVHGHLHEVDVDGRAEIRLQHQLLSRDPLHATLQRHEALLCLGGARRGEESEHHDSGKTPPSDGLVHDVLAFEAVPPSAVTTTARSSAPCPAASAAAYSPALTSVRGTGEPTPA